MGNSTIIKKEVLQCRSCKQTFNKEDIKVVQTERYGLLKDEKVCPHCGSNTYGKIDYDINEEELIYKTGKFYLHNGKQVAYRINKIINEDSE